MLFIVGVFLVIFLGGAVAVARERRKRRLRRERIHAAAAEAAQDDGYLAAELVEKEASDLWLATQAAWDQRDEARLAQLVSPDLLVEWRRRLADFEKKGWHNRVQVANAPAVTYVGLVNREDDAQDRVTVHIAGDMTSFVQTSDGQKVMRDGATSEQVSIAEYWTLARNGDGWMCVSIEQEAEGGHHLEAAVVATPESDTERIRGEAVTELAVADAVPEGFTTADLAVFDFQGSAREEALDLSLADGRFAPDVLEVAARRAVAAWAEAVDGEDAELAAMATPEALQRLLYGADPSGKTRLVLRGPRVRRISIAGVDPRATPARMSLEVEVAATRYVEDRDTVEVVSGDKSGPSTFTEHWTMALDGPPDSPWRLVATA